jgi:hypothetical protein
MKENVKIVTGMVTAGVTMMTNSFTYKHKLTPVD